MIEQRLPTSALLVRTFVCVMLLAIGVGIAVALFATKPDASRNAVAAPPPRIAVLAIAPIEIERSVQGYGSARALDSADVPARVGAVVASLGSQFSAGAAVSKGDVLVALDASDFERQVEIAREGIRSIDAQIVVVETQEGAARQTAELVRRERDLAETDLQRVVRAAAEGAAQEREVDRARGGLLAANRALIAAEDMVAGIQPRLASLAAQKALESARLGLAQSSAERCIIRAPIAGVLQMADLEPGEFVQPGQTVARIVDRSRIEVPLRIPASSRALAPVGARVEVLSSVADRSRSLARLDTNNAESQRVVERHKNWIGTVARVQPEDDPVTRTATVLVEFEQDPTRTDAIAPGAFVEARLSDGQRVPRTVLPRRAIRDQFVMVVENGIIRERRVTVDFGHVGAIASTGIADVDWAVLVEDLPTGTLIVLDGSRSLVEGQRIEPVIVSEPAAVSEPVAVSEPAAVSAKDTHR